jgi:hypothetical protein
MIQILNIRGGVSSGRIASGVAETGAVRTRDVEGMMALFPAIDAFEGAVAGAMVAMAIGSAALGGVISRWVSTATEEASDCVTFEVANGVICNMAKAVASGALAEGWARFETAGDGLCTKNANGGLEDGFGEKTFWVVNREGERCIACFNIFRSEQPAGRNDKLGS